jgi:predicted ester cyclase
MVEGPAVAANVEIARDYTRRVFKGELLGMAPTGRTVRSDAVDVNRFKDGKISEEWAAGDLTAIPTGWARTRHRGSPSDDPKT